MSLNINKPTYLIDAVTKTKLLTKNDIESVQENSILSSWVIKHDIRKLITGLVKGMKH